MIVIKKVKMSKISNTIWQHLQTSKRKKHILELFTKKEAQNKLNIYFTKKFTGCDSRANIFFLHRSVSLTSEVQVCQSHGDNLYITMKPQSKAYSCDMFLL